MKAFLHIAFLLSAISLFSQSNVNVSWGEEYKFERRIGIREMLSDSSHFYVIKRSTQKDNPWVIIDQYDQHTAQKINFIEIAIPTKGDRINNFEDIFLLEGKIYLFSSAVIQNQKILYATAYDFSNPNNSVTTVEVDHFLLGQNKRFAEPNFEIIEAHDGSSVLVLHNYPFEKYNNEMFSYKCFNAKMELQWAKEIELPYKGKYFKLSNHLIDKFGNVHMLSAISPERIKGENNDRRIPNDKYNLLTYNPKENKLKEFEITLGDKYVSALSFDMAPNGDLVLGGFYSNSQLYSIAGTFYLRLDPNKRSVVSSNLKAFEKNFLLEFLPERKIKKGRELSDFYFDHFMVREDGSALFIAEQYYMQVVYTYNDPFGYGYGAYGYNPYYNSRNNYNYQYYYNDLIVVNVNKEGEIEWTRKIPKRQLSTNDGGYYSSYAFASYNNNVYILFNDNPRNTPAYRSKTQDVYSMTKPSKSIAQFVSIDKKGAVQYSPLFSQRDMKLVLRPKMHYQSAKNQLIIFSQKGNKYKFGSLTLP